MKSIFPSFQKYDFFQLEKLEHYDILFIDICKIIQGLPIFGLYSL